MGITIEIVRNERQRREFIRLPRQIYAGDANWVPPLLGRMQRTIDSQCNTYLQRGPHRLFLAYRDGAPAGRVMAGVDQATNRAKGATDGWFALFECVEDYRVASALLDAAHSYLAGLGCGRMRGPVSPTGGDDYRGLLIDGFDSPPVLMDSYNPRYYADFLERLGFTKYIDWFAYRFSYRMPKNPRAVEYARKRYGFRLDRLDLSRLERETRDIHTVLARSMPEWPDQTTPSLEQVREIARDLKSYADPDFVYLARVNDEPIGFCLSMPDLNQVLIHLNGRLYPLGWLKYLYWRRRIDALRFFVLFVVPEWQKKGVTAAFYVKTFEMAGKKGIKWAEGSTIREENLPMRRDMEGAGGEHYKTFRVYSRASLGRD